MSSSGRLQGSTSVIEACYNKSSSERHGHEIADISEAYMATFKVLRTHVADGDKMTSTERSWLVGYYTWQRLFPGEEKAFPFERPVDIGERPKRAVGYVPLCKGCKTTELLGSCPIVYVERCAHGHRYLVRYGFETLQGTACHVCYAEERNEELPDRDNEKKRLAGQVKRERARKFVEDAQKACFDFLSDEDWEMITDEAEEWMLVEKGDMESREL